MEKQVDKNKNGKGTMGLPQKVLLFIKFKKQPWREYDWEDFESVVE